MGIANVLNQIDLRLDLDGTGKLWDESIQGFVAPRDTLVLLTKSDGTQQHKPIVCLAFPVLLPDDTHAIAHCVITGRLFANMADAFMGAHPNAGDRDDPELMKNAAMTPSGSYLGVGWNALKMEQVYLIKIEGTDGVSFAGSEKELVEVAQASIEKLLRKQTEGK